MAKRKKSQLWVARIETMCGQHPEQIILLGRATDLGSGFKEIKRLTLNQGGVEKSHYVLLRQVSDIITATIEHTEKAVLLQESVIGPFSGNVDDSGDVDEAEEAVAQGDTG